MKQLEDDAHFYIEAVRLAHRAHVEQKYGDMPYTRHLAHVENVLVRFSFTDYQMLSAAWLHDSIEDGTGITAEMLAERFGSYIAHLVDCVSDGKGANRKERKVESYRKMQEFPQAIPLKLADRIANVESCIFDGNEELFEMYRKEHGEFRRQLFDVSSALPPIRVGVRAMWNYLDELFD